MVKPQIDMVFAETSPDKLYEFVCQLSLAPEARILAVCRLQAIIEAAKEERQAVSIHAPAGVLKFYRNALAKAYLRCPMHYGGIWDTGPGPGQAGPVPGRGPVAALEIN